MGGHWFLGVKMHKALNCELMGFLLPITDVGSSSTYKTGGKIVKSHGKMTVSHAQIFFLPPHSLFFPSSHLPSLENQHEGSLCYVRLETWTLLELS